MLKAYYVEINPTKTQAKKIRQTIGVCRFVYNFYVAHNSENYKQGGKFISGMSFEKWMNNEYLPQNIDKRWIKDVSSKAVKQSIMNGQKAFNDFFKNGKGYPNFKKKNNEDVKAYFPKNNKTDWAIEDKRVKIPTLGFVRLKERGYIPLNSNVKSGTVSVKAGRYYVSVLCDVDVSSTANQDNSFNDGIGADFGIKDLIVASNGITIGNINKSKEMKRLSKKLKRGCGYLHRELKLSHRKFVCPNCDSKLDRDWNASINLRNTDQYTVA